MFTLTEQFTCNFYTFDLMGEIHGQMSHPNFLKQARLSSQFCFQRGEARRGQYILHHLKLEKTAHHFPRMGSKLIIEDN